MNQLADLHTHTIFSDGILSPTELFTKAKEVGLSVIVVVIVVVVVVIIY